MVCIMKFVRIVGERGQVVIPKDIREYLNIKPGSEIIFEVRNGEIVLKPRVQGKEFVEEYFKVPKKLDKWVDLKSIIEGELNERISLY